MKKKFILFIFGLLIIIFSVYILLFTNKEKKTINKINIPIPEITGAVGVRAVFQFMLPSDFSLPQKALLISQTSSSSFKEEEVKKIAESLYFTKEPKIFNDTLLGKTYLYSAPLTSLTIYSDAKIIRFSQYTQDKPKKRLEDKEYINLAESFLSRIPLKNSYRFSFFNYFSTQPLQERYDPTTKEEANTIQVNLSPINKDIKILMKSPDLSLATVTMNVDGYITKVEIRDIDELTFSDQEYQLISFDEIKNSTEKFVLMTLDNGYYPNLELIKNEITKCDINQIELVYFYDYQERSVIQPVFLIKGKASLQNTEDEVDISFYLPAFKE
jgi:hypothetical protein